MTTANHFMTSTGKEHTGLLAGREFTVGEIVRLFTQLIGVALLLAAAGLWIAPNATNIPELLMMKLCASFFFALTGLHVLFMARKPRK